jgi:hypothetical protein
MAENQTQEDFSIDELLGGIAPDMINAGHTPYIFTNEKGNPAPIYILNTFFKGVVDNRVGIAVCKDSVTGNEELVLVGIVGRAESGDSLDIVPLAVVIRQDDVARFLPPDGNGGYLNDSQDS